jgi:hypothetical protein
MKKRTLVFIVLIPAFILLIAFTEGPPAGYTGSPLDGLNCTNCHGILPAGNISGWVSSNIPDEGYIPGETYTITVAAIGIVAVKMGFQITAENQAEKAGTFLITDPERTQLKGSTTVTHTVAGTEVTSLPATWTQDWIAPASGTGEITFYAAVNQTNNDNSANNDLIYLSTLTAAEASVGIDEYYDELILQISPNPFTSSTTLSYTLDRPENIRFTVYNLQSQIVYKVQEEREKGEQQLQWKADGLPAGLYFFRIQIGGKVGSGKIVKVE